MIENDMTSQASDDQQIRVLARGAGDGDLMAARRLVVLLERRASSGLIGPATPWADVPESLFPTRGMKARVVNALLRIGVATIGDATSVGMLRIRGIAGIGPASVNAICAVMDTAGVRVGWAAAAEPSRPAEPPRHETRPPPVSPEAQGMFDAVLRELNARPYPPFPPLRLS